MQGLSLHGPAQPVSCSFSLSIKRVYIQGYKNMISCLFLHKWMASNPRCSRLHWSFSLGCYVSHIITNMLSFSISGLLERKTINSQNPWQNSLLRTEGTQCGIYSWSFLHVFNNMNLINITQLEAFGTWHRFFYNIKEKKMWPERAHLTSPLKVTGNT
jgi:hypothetical protein